MSVYLGKNKVGVAYQEENKNVLDQETKARLNDAIGYRVGDFKTRNLEQMIEAAKEEYFVNRDYYLFPAYENKTWVRPSTWPDLDSLNLEMSGDDFIYMTYDNTTARAAIALHIEKITNGQNIIVEIGHITNGTYIVDNSISSDSNNNFVYWFTENDVDYPVVRVTGDIKCCYSYSVTEDGMTQHYRRQPIVERIAYVPHLIYFCTSYNANAWGVLSLKREKFNNDDGSALTSCYYAWAFCRELQDLDISGLKTQNVTSFDSMFKDVQKLFTLDLRHLDTNKVKNFGATFYRCRALRLLDLRGWDTSSITTLSGCFDTCLNLLEIKGIENFITNNVTNFSYLFNNCRCLKSLDLTSWNTEKATTFNSCFANCQSLQELDLSNWNPKSVTNFGNMFDYCYFLKRLNLDTWAEKGTGVITSVYSLFRNCWSLQSIDVSWLHLTSSCTTIFSLFSNCYSLKELNIPSDWNLSGISSSNNTANSVFSGCWSLKKITGISNWNFQFSNSLASMFNNCYSLKEVDVSNWTVNDTTNLSSCFANCSSLEELDLSNWNPENCTTFNSMFSGCYSLKTLGNINNWDTSKCTNMGSMFRYCYSLQEFPSIQNWDLSLVTTIDSIFSECLSLEEVEWKNANLPVCTNINQIFRYDCNLHKIDLSNWTIPAVSYSASYYHTLGDCWTLKDLIGFPIPSTYTNLGFQNCENLSYESLMVIVNSLPQVTGTHTLRIPAMSLNTLTTEEKAIATNKGWTLANS